MQGFPQVDVVQDMQCCQRITAVGAGLHGCSWNVIESLPQKCRRAVRAKYGANQEPKSKIGKAGINHMHHLLVLPFGEGACHDDLERLVTYILEIATLVLSQP